MEPKYRVYLMDMLSSDDGEGCTENSRLPLGTVTINTELKGAAWNQAVLEALRDGNFADVTGRHIPLFTPAVNLSAFYVEDVDGFGEWLEVGLDNDDHCPAYSLEAIA